MPKSMDLAKQQRLAKLASAISERLPVKPLASVKSRVHNFAKKTGKKFSVFAAADKGVIIIRVEVV
jgi:hypothetical protein